MTTRLQGAGEPLVVETSGPTCIIGERINPTGKRKLLEALRERRWESCGAFAQSFPRWMLLTWRESTVPLSYCQR